MRTSLSARRAFAWCACLPLASCAGVSSAPSFPTPAGLPPAAASGTGAFLSRGADGSLLRVVRVESADSASGAGSAVAGRHALFLGMYEPQLPPYPEFVTRQTGCDARFLPSAREAPAGRWFLAPAGERYGFGLCADYLVKFRASVGWYPCADGSVWEVAYFAGTGASEGDLAVPQEGFRCPGIDSTAPVTHNPSRP